jgi:hypothetical protein
MTSKVWGAGVFISIIGLVVCSYFASITMPCNVQVCGSDPMFVCDSVTWQVSPKAVPRCDDVPFDFTSCSEY